MQIMTFWENDAVWKIGFYLNSNNVVVIKEHYLLVWLVGCVVQFLDSIKPAEKLVNKYETFCWAIMGPLSNKTGLNCFNGTQTGRA